MKKGIGSVSQLPIIKSRETENFSQPNVTFRKRRFKILALGLLILKFVLLYIFVWKMRNRLPAVDMDLQPLKQHLKTLTSDRHSWNSGNNQKVFDYLYQTLLSIQQESPFIEIEIQNQTVENYFLISNIHFIYQSQNILVKIPSSSSQKALLISSHFDSAVTSYGAFDDGIPVSVCLELIKVYAKKTLDRDLIFLFGNGEESGLLDARSFTLHPWFQQVDAFMNLESGGVGTRELLFRSTNDQLSLQYALAVPYPHANAIAKDVFNLGLISSNTDFSVVGLDGGIKGLDVAFYEGRGRYHTPKDNYDAITDPVLYRYYKNMEAAIPSLASFNSDLPDTFYLYYDVLGSSVIHYSFGNYHLFNSALLFTFIMFLMTFISWYKKKHQQLIMGETCRLYGLLLAYFFISLVVSVIIGFIIQAANGFVLASRPLLAAATIFFLCHFPILLAVHQWALVMLKRRNEHKLEFPQMHLESKSWIAYWMFWNGFQAFALLFGLIGYAAFYFVQWWNLFGLIVNVLSNYFSLKNQKASLQMSILLVIISFLVPMIFTLDLLYTLMNALAPTILEGTSSLVIFMLMSLFTLLFTTPIFPLLSRFHYKRILYYLSLIIGLILLIVTCVVFPFTSDSPMKIRYQSFQNQSSNQSWVRLTGYGKNLPSLANQFDTNFQCNPLTSATECILKTGNASLSLQTNFQQTEDSIVGTVQAPDQSAICQLSYTAKSNSSVYLTGMNRTMHFYADDQPSFRIYTQVQETPWTWQFQLSPGINVALNISCFVDDLRWNDQYLKLEAELPEWATFMSYGDGLTTVTSSYWF